MGVTPFNAKHPQQRKTLQWKHSEREKTFIRPTETKEKEKKEKKEKKREGRETVNMKKLL